MWVEFVVGSHPRAEDFSPGTSVFLPPQKPTLLNSNSIWDTSTTVLSCVNLFIKKNWGYILFFSLLVQRNPQRMDVQVY